MAVREACVTLEGMRVPFVIFLVALSSACSTANFSVAADPDGGGGAGDTGAVVDTGAVPPVDGAVPDAGPGAIEGGTTDAGAVVDSGPPCEPKVPDISCSSSGAYVLNYDLSPSGPSLAPRLTHSVSHAVSFTLTKAGRIEKIGFKLARNDNGAGTDGDVTVTAGLIVCKDTILPLGKHVKKSADVPYDTTFYFNPSVAPGVPYLPYLPAGARLVFQIETTSTRYEWDLRGQPLPASNPMGFTWATKTGTAPWTLPSASQIAATMTYIREC